MANIKTIALTGAETAVSISGQNCDIRNDGTDVVYASTEAGIVAGADGVLSIPAGGAAKLLDANGTVYLLGTGSVMLCGNDYSELVFKSAATSSGGGGGEDTVARNAINAHAGNSEIHLTTAELDAAVEGAKTYSDSGDEQTLEAAKDYSDSGDEQTLEAAKKYADALSMGGGGGVSQTYVDMQDGVTLDAAKQYAAGLVQPVSAAVDTLNGTGEGSVAKTVSDEVAKLVADAPDDLDTLKEISDWITNHHDDAAAMNTAITQNAADIAANAAAIADINNADNGILAQANTYSDSVGAEAAAYSDVKAAETLDAARAYADAVAGGSGSTVGGVTEEYVDAQDAATLASAQTYADGIGAAANTYTDNAISAKLITGTAAASLDNCPEGCWYGQYS